MSMPIVLQFVIRVAITLGAVVYLFFKVGPPGSEKRKWMNKK
jgi:hypothetical protein